MNGPGTEVFYTEGSRKRGFSKGPRTVVTYMNGPGEAAF